MADEEEVTFDVFGPMWDSKTAYEQLMYTEKYFAWLCLGNKPVTSMSGDGLSVTWDAGRVEKLLNYLTKKSNACGYMTSVPLRPNYFI
jgi:hypothetical protein